MCSWGGLCKYIEQHGAVKVVIVSTRLEGWLKMRPLWLTHIGGCWHWKTPKWIDRGLLEYGNGSFPPKSLCFPHWYGEKISLLGKIWGKGDIGARVFVSCKADSKYIKHIFLLYPYTNWISNFYTMTL